MNDLSPIANLHLIMDNKLKGKFLYWLGWKIVDIAEVLEEKERTVQAWKTRDEWEKEKPENRVECALTVRLMQLILKNKKIRLLICYLSHICVIFSNNYRFTGLDRSPPRFRCSLNTSV